MKGLELRPLRVQSLREGEEEEEEERTMSCNGCRVLRKGCGEACALRPCLQWIERPEAQGHATLFLAKFFGRAGLVSFVSAVPEHHRPAVFQSLLFEACGRSVNPVSGAVGLLWEGNWHLCQAAVETVLRGGTLRSLPQDEGPPPDACGLLPKPQPHQQPPPSKRRKPSPASDDDEGGGVTGCMLMEPPELELCLTTSVAAAEPRPRSRPGTPSEESVTTNADSWVPTAAATAWQQQQPQPLQQQQQSRLLNLFA